MSSTDEKSTAARLHGTVRVSLPAKVAYNPDALKTTIASLLQRLGCLTCFSGADCYFQAERDFVVDPEGGFFHRANALEPSPIPWFANSTASSTLGVALAPGDQNDIDKVYRAVDAVIGKIGGCLPCHSGFDVAYFNEIEFLGINPDGTATQYGGSAIRGQGQVAGFGG